MAKTLVSDISEREYSIKYNGMGGNDEYKIGELVYTTDTNTRGGTADNAEPTHKCDDCRYRGGNCYYMIGQCNGYDKFEFEYPKGADMLLYDDPEHDEKDIIIKKLQDLIDELETDMKEHMQHYTRKARKRMIRWYGRRMFQ